MDKRLKITPDLYERIRAMMHRKLAEHPSARSEYKKAGLSDKGEIDVTPESEKDSVTDGKSDT